MERNDISPVVRVLLVDDEPTLRNGIAGLLNDDPRIEIVATADGGEQALAVLRERLVDVAVVDVEMPGIDGVKTAESISRSHPRVKVVMFTAFERHERLSAAMAAGAVGFLTKDMEPKDVVEGILKAHSGERVLSSRATDMALGALRALGLRQREREAWNSLVRSLTPGQRKVYDVLITGASNREIAKKVNYSEGTVRVYVTQILDALGCKSRTEVALLAARSEYMNNAQ